ncbi:origin recognition complex subunit 2-like [Oratosquilla oratoria]|uniref:origin recognition complex subunit 2-like n=1 Tax=Oratosquilla oratoria TaxID=337810 RepID=UPI003F76018F
MDRKLRKKIAVTFVDECNVDKVQLFDKENAKPGLHNRGSKQRNPDSFASGVLQLRPLEEMDDEEVSTIYKPISLIEESDNTVVGSDVFGFRTPKKRMGMHEKVLEATGFTPKTPRTPVTPKTPKTPKSLQNLGLRTPKSGKKGGRNTPKSRRSLSTSLQESATPYSFRKRVSQRIQKIVYDEDDSSESEEDSDFNLSGDSSSDEERVNETYETPQKSLVKTILSITPSKAPGKTPVKTPAKGKRRKAVTNVDMTADSEEYFMHHTDSGKIVTSDHTLNRLKTPRLSQEALQSILSGLELSHKNEREAMLEEHLLQFQKWMVLLSEGYSIFLHGLGSKKQLLNEFQQQMLQDLDHMVINGFFPSLTIKSILNGITEDMIGYSGSFHSVQDHTSFIYHHYNGNTCDPLFLVINNVDGPMLRGGKAQAALSQLASSHHIHIIASVDHINAPLLFDSTKLSCYNVLWWDATTFAPYSEETSYENSLLLQQSGSLALSSLIHVFNSLTPNAKGIFLLLANHQLEEKDHSNYNGLSFAELYQQCREKFLVNSDLTLRAQLTEFRDHKLIRSKKSHDGTENLIIPLNESTLKEFVEQQSSESF